MKQPEEEIRSGALIALTEEARTHLTPGEFGAALDWARIEHGIETARAKDAERSLWRKRAGALAIAAGGLGFLGAQHDWNTHSGYSLHTESRTVSPAVVSHTVRELGEVKASANELRNGDTLRVSGTGRVVLAHSVAGKHIDWSLSAAQGEAGSAQVTTDHGALRIALEQGSVECDVEPGSKTPILFVEAGKARIVVRGTHFRVERHGDAVRVDLTRGKVSVEDSGSAVQESHGTSRLLSAPAHASIRLDNGSMSIAEDADVMAEEGFVALPQPAPQPGIAAAKVVAARTLMSRQQLTGQLEACIVRGLPKGTAAGVSLETTLAVTVDGSGNVVASTFDPPVAPEAERCAKDILQRHTLSERGEVVRLPFQVAR